MHFDEVAARSPKWWKNVPFETPASATTRFALRPAIPTPAASRRPASTSAARVPAAASARVLLGARLQAAVD